MTANGHGVSFWGDENVLKVIVVMVYKSEYTNKIAYIYCIYIILHCIYCSGYPITIQRKYIHKIKLVSV